jgi:hypothetical protein
MDFLRTRGTEIETPRSLTARSIDKNKIQRTLLKAADETGDTPAHLSDDFCQAETADVKPA